AEFFGTEAVPLQIARSLIGEKDVGVLQQAIEFGAILFGVVEDGLAHPDLHIPGKSLDLSVPGSPDVEDIGAMLSEVSAHRGAGNHMPHSEGTNAVQRAGRIPRKRHWRAVAYLLDRDQWHSRKHVGVLRFLAEFLEGAYLRHHDTGFSPGELEIVCA